MADKRIWELTNTTVKTGKYIALDSNVQVAAHRFLADLLVDSVSNETIGGIKTFSQNAIFQAVVTMSGLASDDTEDHLVAINDTSGLLKKRAVSSIKPAVGAAWEIPYTNNAATDLIYSSALRYQSGIFYAQGGITVSALSISQDSIVMAGGLGVGNLKTSASLYYTGTVLNTNSLKLNAGNTVNNIEATLTNNSTRIATSSAIFAAIAAIPPGFTLSGSTTDGVLTYLTSTSAQVETYFTYNSTSRILTITSPATSQGIGCARLGQVNYNAGSSTESDYLYSGFVWLGNSSGAPSPGVTLAMKHYRTVDGDYIYGHLNIASNGNLYYKYNANSIDPSAASGGTWKLLSTQTLTIGATTQIPVTNTTGNNFIYSTNLTLSAAGYLRVNGRIGINTTPAQMLHVVSTSTDIASFYSSSATYGRVYIENTAAADSQLAFRTSASTKWSIGNRGSDDFFIISQGFGAFGTNDYFKLGTTGNVGIGIDPQVLTRLGVKGAIAGRFESSTASGTWVDFPTALPAYNTIFRNEANVDVGVNTFQGILLYAQGVAGTTANAQAYIAVEAMSASDHRARLNLLMSGSTSTDFRTPMRIQYDGTVYWQTELSTQDITHYWRQGGTTVAVTGWDDTYAAFSIQRGTAFTTSGNFRISATTTAGFYGSSTANFYIDAASSTASIYIQANSTSDSRIFFRNDTTTRFIMGHDYSGAIFQIHSSSSFTTTGSADFSIGTDGRIYFGNLVSGTPPYYVYHNPSTGEIQYGSTSDKRNKKNIKPWKKDALKALSKIPVMQYHHTGENRKMAGAVAQDVLTQIPEMVGVDKKTGLYILGEQVYNRYFHRAIQQLLERIEELEKQIP